MRYPFLIIPLKKLSLRNEEVDLSSNPFTTLRLLNYNVLSEETLYPVTTLIDAKFGCLYRPFDEISMKGGKKFNQI